MSASDGPSAELSSGGAFAAGGEGGGSAEEVKIEKARFLGVATREQLIKPVAVRRIMKIDKEVKMTAAEAVILMAKATELFTEDLIDKTLARTLENNRDTISGEDIFKAAADSPHHQLFAGLFKELSRADTSTSQGVD